MALPTTGLTTQIIKTILGEDANKVYHPAVSPFVNKWSRYKPLRSAIRPEGDGKFGFNLPASWDYLQPRGGSPGGAIDEPGRMGDFRGYEHDRDIATPVVYVDQNSVTLKDTLIPGVQGDGYLTGSITFNMNTADDNVRITPADLALNNYYWGIKLVLPGGAGTYYKTGTSVLSNGWVKTISVLLTNLTTPAFADCPYAIGTFSWEAFICSTSAPAWTMVAPSNIILLPTGTYGSKTIVNSGTFEVSQWMTASNTDITWEYFEYGNRENVYKFSTVHTNTGLNRWCVLHCPSWLSYAVMDEGGTLDLTASPERWNDQCILRMYPNEAMVWPDAALNGEVILGDFADSNGTHMESIIVNHSAAPEIIYLTPGLWSGDDSGLTISAASGNVTVGSSTIYITFTPSLSGTIYARIKYRTVDQGLDVIYGCTAGVSKYIGITANTPAAHGDLVLVELSGNPIV